MKLASAIITALPGLKDSIANTGFVSTFLSATEVVFFRGFDLHVCLSVTSISQKRVDGVGWNCVCRYRSGQ